MQPNSAGLVPILVLMIVATISAFGMMVLWIWIFRLWVKGMASGVPLSIFEILGMKLRGNPPSLMIDTFITLRYGGDAWATLTDIERTYMAHKHEKPRWTVADLVPLVRRAKSQPLDDLGQPMT